MRAAFSRAAACARPVAFGLALVGLFAAGGCSRYGADEKGFSARSPRYTQERQDQSQPLNVPGTPKPYRGPIPRRYPSAVPGEKKEPTPEKSPGAGPVKH